MKMPLSERLGIIVDQYIEQNPGTTWGLVLEELGIITRSVEGLREELSNKRTLH